MTLERRGDHDRIDALAVEMRAGFQSITKTVNDGFAEVTRERQKDRDYLKQVLFIGNGGTTLPANTSNDPLFTGVAYIQFQITVGGFFPFLG